MELAIREAKKASIYDEVPVGCVIVKDGKVVARAYNKRNRNDDVFGHAEIIAIKKANKILKSWRLENCDMYVTLEPCIMCAGAIIQSRIRNIYFGAYDVKGGAFGSTIDVSILKNLNHHPFVYGGVLKEECSELLKSYFEKKRGNNNEK